jgi:Mg-chelatase subunit ChlD
MKTRVFNLIILDESGSMSIIKSQAISGVNETVQTIRSAQAKHEDQEHYVTLVSFNSDAVKTIYDNIPAANIEELTDRQYEPNSCTPLYDAMGNSLNKLRKSVADNDVVLVTIITDGYENDSHEYTRPIIKKLVEELKAKGWVFTYIGANQDVEQAAMSIAVDNSMSFCASVEGTNTMFAKERRARSRFFDKVAKGIFYEDRYFDSDDDEEKNAGSKKGK